MRAAAAILLASASSACVDRRVMDVPLDGHAFEYGFVVLLDEEGAATRVSPPFGVADGALTFGTLPAYELESEEQAMLLVGLPPGAVRGAVSSFDEARAERMELVPFGPTELPFYVNEADSGEHLFVDVPAGARVLRGDFEGALAEDAVPESFALRVPIAPEQCSRFDPAGLVPFGVDAQIIPADLRGEQDNFFFVDLFDEETVLGMTPRVLYLLRADEPFVARPVTRASPGNRLAREALPRGIAHNFGGIELDREAGRAWLAVTLSEDRIVTDGVLMELSIAGGELGVVSTATVPGVFLEDVVLDDRRRPIILGLHGELFRYEDEGTFTVLPSIEGFAPAELTYRLHATGDPAFPYLASSEGRLHVYRAAEARWSSEVIPSSWLRTLSTETMYKATGLASRRTPEGELELWAAGTSGVLVRKVGEGPWENVEIAYPPRFEGCSSSTEPYPGLAFTNGFDTIEFLGEDMFLTLRECTTAVQLRMRTGCTALLSIGGVEPVFYDSDLQAMDIFGDTIVVAGEEGLMFRGKLR